MSINFVLQSHEFTTNHSSATPYAILKATLFKFAVVASMLLGLPLLGVFIKGGALPHYFEFPPLTRYVEHNPFSWWVFGLLAVFTVASILPLLLQALHGKSTRTKLERAFPAWGWAGVLMGIAAWMIAWNRFPWAAAFQMHSFTPLWIAYVIVMNALAWRRTGRSLLTDRPGFLLALFPLSAIFWWFFEYLNRFVQNWYYVAVDLGPWKYFWLATLPFSTVLPAVLSTQEWVGSFSFLRKFESYKKVGWIQSRSVAAWVFFIAAVGLAGIGVWPNFFYPLLWVSPLLILVSLQAFVGERNALAELENGDWRRIVSAALAAVICGFFWEMWNFYSLARWEYAVPYVNRFYIFEMPLLGYAGYLPFGLECMVVGDLLKKSLNRNSHT